MKIKVGELRQIVREAVGRMLNYGEHVAIANEAIGMFEEAEARGAEARKAAPYIYKWVVEKTTFEFDPKAPRSTDSTVNHRGLNIVALVTKKDGWYGELLRRAARDYQP